MAESLEPDRHLALLLGRGSLQPQGDESKCGLGVSIYILQTPRLLWLLAVLVHVLQLKCQRRHVGVEDLAEDA